MVPCQEFCTRGFSGDGGEAVQAQLDLPSSVSADKAGNLYVADTRNHRIRKIDAKTGIITTVVGSETDGSTGDGGPGTQATLVLPLAVHVTPSGDLLVSDTYNQRVRRVAGIAARSDPVSVDVMGDFDRNGRVEFADFVQFAQQYGNDEGTPDFDARFDLNGNGTVDFPDFVQFAQVYGQS